MIRSDPITVNRSDPVPHVHGNFEITENIDHLVIRFKEILKMKIWEKIGNEEKF